MVRGTLFVISAPSGAGKTSLVKALLDACTRLVVSVSYTTRGPRPAEVNGKDYHFIDKFTFERMVAEENFLEYAQVHGNYYGTSKLEINKLLEQNIDVILEIDWQGAQQVRKQFPDACSVFIIPPSIEQLKARLEKRGQDNEAIIAKRMADALSHLSHYHEFDFVVVNDDFKTALDDLKSIVHARRLAITKQKSQLKELLTQMNLV